MALASDAWRWRETPRPDDPAAVRRLVGATGFFRPGEVDVAVELVETALRDGPAAGYRFVFADPADPAGRAGPAPSPGGYACFGEIPCTVARFDLYWIAVDPAHQGRGLGTALFEAARERMGRAGGRRCFVETSGTPRYAPTRRFYEKCGGATAARIADYYDEGDDLVVYTWPLAAPRATPAPSLRPG